MFNLLSNLLFIVATETYNTPPAARSDEVVYPQAVVESVVPQTNPAAAEFTNPRAETPAKAGAVEEEVSP